MFRYIAFLSSSDKTGENVKKSLIKLFFEEIYFKFKFHRGFRIQRSSETRKEMMCHV